MRVNHVLADAGGPSKVIQSRAPFTPDPSQIDLIETLARSATATQRKPVVVRP